MNTEKMGLRCDECRHFVPGTHECRRYPPVHGVSVGAFVFPKVLAHDWCGEHSALLLDSALTETRSAHRSAPIPRR